MWTLGRTSTSFFSCCICFLLILPSLYCAWSGCSQHKIRFFIWGQILTLRCRVIFKKCFIHINGWFEIVQGRDTSPIDMACNKEEQITHCDLLMLKWPHACPINHEINYMPKSFFLFCLSFWDCWEHINSGWAQLFLIQVLGGILLDGGLW